VLIVQPITFREACAFVGRHHRHHKPPQGWLFGCAANDGDRVVGVVMVGRPVARHLDNGWTAEVTRLCILDGARNVASMLYGAAWRAARALGEYFTLLADRLRYTRVCCGDWERVVRPSVTTTNGVTAILLDPPYPADADRNMHAYGVEDGTVAHDVHDWAKANGNNPMLRIAVCGYEGTHDELEDLGWSVEAWTPAAGYSVLAKKAERGKANRGRERIWFSPHCLGGVQLRLDFGGMA